MLKAIVRRGGERLRVRSVPRVLRSVPRSGVCQSFHRKGSSEMLKAIVRRGDERLRVRSVPRVLRSVPRAQRSRCCEERQRRPKARGAELSKAFSHGQILGHRAA